MRASDGPGPRREGRAAPAGRGAGPRRSRGEGGPPRSREGGLHGVQPVLEALRSGQRVDRVYLARDAGEKTRRIVEAAGEAGVKLVRVERAELDRRAGTEKHQGVFAELDRNEVPTVEVDAMVDRAEAAGEAPLIVLLDGLQDPHNLGAILRTAHALGAHGVVIPKDRAVQVTATVVRASAGAALHVPVARVTNLKHALERLAARGVWSAAAVMDGQEARRARLDGPLALVVGGEGGGVRPTVAERCDLRISVRLARGFDSLNASVAAGMLLYEAVRQRLDNVERAQ